MGLNKYKTIGAGEKVEDNYMRYALEPIHLDEILPVDMVTIGGNEWGQLAMMKVMQLEFTDVSWGLTLDDVAAAERVSFVARSIVPWKEVTSTVPGEGGGGGGYVPGGPGDGG